MKKLVKIPIVLCIIAIIFSFFIFKNQNNSSIKNPIVKILLKKVKVPEEYEMVDKNKNDVFDPIDLVNAAREEAKNKTKYKSAYYVGGYTPKGEGVCTDVIWRAFNGAGIDFRRVPNLNVFFQRHALSLTKEVKPFNIDNLRQWQPGDIVVFLEPYEHIGIISDKRGKDGVPYIIHNSNPHASEVRNFNLWHAKVAGHYRWRFSDESIYEKN